MDWQWGNMKVEEALVRSVGGCAWPEGGGKKFDTPAMGFFCAGIVKMLEAIMAMRKGFEDFEGAAFGNGEFSYAVVGSRAVDFDLGSDDVAWFALDKFSSGVDAVGGSEAAVFSEVS